MYINMDYKMLLFVCSAIVIAQAQPGAKQIPANSGSGIRINPISTLSGRLPPVPGPVRRPAPSNGVIRSNTGNVGANGQPNADPNNTPVTCASTGRSAIAQCFQSNGGIQMQFVVSLLSNGTQIPLPRNADQIKRTICGSESNIITCIFTGVNGLQNSPRCPSMSQYARLEQETVGLIGGLQQLCGKGPLPPPSTCLKNLNKNLQDCYSQVGLNPDLFTPSGSGSGSSKANQVIGAIIGENSKVAKNFCRSKKRLFECMKTTLDKCPGSVEVMGLSGYDHESLQKGIDVLCHDVSVYVDGLKCFQKPTPEVTSCYNTMVENVTNLTTAQLQRPMSIDEFYSKFCQLRIQHMDCDLKAWANTCDKRAVGLKNEFECNLLPTRCKNSLFNHDKLQQTCAIKNFQRHSRSGAVRHLSISGIIISFLSFGVMLIL